MRVVLELTVIRGAAANFVHRWRPGAAQKSRFHRNSTVCIQIYAWDPWTRFNGPENTSFLQKFFPLCIKGEFRAICWFWVFDWASWGHWLIDACWFEKNPRTESPLQGDSGSNESQSSFTVCRWYDGEFEKNPRRESPLQGDSGSNDSQSRFAVCRWNNGNPRELFWWADLALLWPWQAPLIGNISCLAALNNVELNAAKSDDLVVVSKPPPSACLFMNGPVIPRVPCHVHLGITITSDLRWNDHVANVLKKFKVAPAVHLSLTLAYLHPISPAVIRKF